MDKIFIEKLRLEANIGIHEWEKAVPQEILIDVELGCDIRKAAQSDSIDDALNYAAVVDAISEFVNVSRFLLVETMAEHMASLLFDNFDLDTIRLKISKTQVITNVSAVGVEIERRKNDKKS